MARELKHDFTGKKVGKLTVIGRHDDARHGTWWLCRCECGKEKVIQGQALRNGSVVSCGCYMRENNRTHGGSKERLYGIWRGIRVRCSDPNNRSYKYYGAKGVRVCDEWANDYAAFRDWALSNGYDPEAPFQECTIDRINPFGDYEPSNCRWVDIVTQERNRRDAYARKNHVA